MKPAKPLTSPLPASSPDAVRDLLYLAVVAVIDRTPGLFASPTLAGHIASDLATAGWEPPRRGGLHSVAAPAPSAHAQVLAELAPGQLEDRIETLAMVEHSRNHWLMGTSKVCGRCRARARAIADLIVSGPTGGGRR